MRPVRPLVLTLLVIAGLLAFVGPAQAAPVNDDFPGATITGQSGTYSSTTSAATQDAGGPSPGAADVWHSWNAPVGGKANFDICGATGDSFLQIFTGSAVNALTQIASDDDSCGNDATLSFLATAGTDYRIRVWNFCCTFGAYTLNWSVTGPGNDDFADATQIDGFAFSALNQFNLLATGETGEPNNGGVSSPLESVWYRWTAPLNESFTFHTCDASFDTTIGIYTGTAVDALSVVASNDDACGTGGTRSSVTFDATANVEYFISVDGKAGDEGSFRLDWTLGPRPTGPPANDDFASAEVLTGTGGTTLGTTLFATEETDEPNHANNSNPIESAWYAWTAPGNGSVTFDTCIASVQLATMAAYTGTAVDGLTTRSAEVGGCGGGTHVTLPVQLGTTYHVAVDGFQDQTGAYILRWSFRPPPANDDFSGARVISGNEGWAGGTLDGATAQASEPGIDPGEPTVWYRYKPPSDGTVVLSVCEMGYDVNLHVYTGSSLGALSLVESAFTTSNCGENNDGPMLQFTADDAVTYRIRVSSFGFNDFGPFSLRFGRLAAGNDAFATPQVLTGDSGMVAGSNIATTGEIDEDSPIAGEVAPLQSVWFSWTPSTSGTAFFAACVAGFDSAISVYQASTLAETSSGGIAGNTAGECGGLFVDNAAVKGVAVTGGTTYRIAVDSSGSDEGLFFLDWSLLSATDDDFGSVVLTGAHGAIAGTNESATGAPGDVHTYGASDPIASVWYSWTPEVSGSVVFHTCSATNAPDSEFDSALAAYTGSSLTTLEPVGFARGCPDPHGIIEFDAVAGTEYHVSVDGFDDSVGHYILRWDQATPPLILGANLEAGVDDSADPVPAGTVVTYTARVRNVGPGDATNVVGRIELPGTGKLVSVTPEQGSCGAPSGRTVVCSFGNIASGDSVDTAVVWRSTHRGNQRLRLLGLDSDEDDPVSNNNSSAETTTIAVNTTVVPGESCTIVGTNVPETLNGTSGNDVICLLGGADTSNGGAGNDRIYGGAGNDVLTGGGGGDTLNGEGGNDNLKAKDGVSGNDTVNGGNGTGDQCTRDPGDTVTGCP